MRKLWMLSKMTHRSFSLDFGLSFDFNLVLNVLITSTRQTVSHSSRIRLNDILGAALPKELQGMC